MMERSRAVNAAAYSGSVLSGMLLTGVGTGGAPPGSSAYLPMPLAVAVSGNRAAFALAAAVAFAVPFAGSFIGLRLSRR